MRSSASKTFALGLSLGLMVAFCAFGAEHAWARAKKQRPAEPSSFRGIMVDETPVIMQGLERPKRAVAARHHAGKEAERPVNIPRGSASFVPSSTGGLPRTPLMIQSPTVAPYNPPPISNPSERITQFNHSFPLNGGLGNNPTDRDAYIRYNLNR